MWRIPDDTARLEHGRHVHVVGTAATRFDRVVIRYGGATASRPLAAAA